MASALGGAFVHSGPVDSFEIPQLGTVVVPPGLRDGTLGNQLYATREGDLIHLYVWQFVNDADPTGEWPDTQAGVVVAHFYLPQDQASRLGPNLTRMIDHLTENRDESP